MSYEHGDGCGPLGNDYPDVGDDPSYPDWYPEPESDDDEGDDDEIEKV